MGRRLLLFGIGLSVAAAALFFITRTRPLTETRVTVGGTTFTVDVVRAPLEQSQGLRGRNSLAPDHGMFFVFADRQDRTFTMTGMRLALDFIWIADGTVVGLTEQAPPDPWTSSRRYPSPAPVDRVLELAAGTAKAQGLSIGATVTETLPQ